MKWSKAEVFYHRYAKRALSVTVTVGLLAGTAGCLKEQLPAVSEQTEVEESDMETAGDEAAPAWERLADSDITLDWYINYSWFATPWGENLVSQTITQETGVNVNFITPIGNETEKLNALIASDSLPDIITLGYWEPQVNEIISKGMVYSLNELADKYDTYFWQITDRAAINWYTKEDGNIYAYPNSSVSPQDLKEHDNIGSNQTFLVRKDIYEAIGSPDMTTTEGFKAAVEKAAAMFPEIDGHKLIPVGAHVFDNEGNVSFDKYLMNFLAVPWEKDGKMYDRYTDSEYIKWLKLFRELGEEGLLANDIFVDTRTQMEEKLAEGRYFCMVYQYTDMISQQKTLYANDPDSIYLAVDGPKNENGADPTLATTSINGWTVTMISKNCKDPERAIAFMDYLISDHGQMVTYLGVEGETYDMVDGYPVIREDVKALLDSDRVTYDQIYGADDAYWMLQDNVTQLQWKQEAPPAIKQLEEWSCQYAVYNGQYDIYLPLDSEEMAGQDKITLLWSETLPRLLLAPTEAEFDTVFADFIEKRAALGYEEVLEQQTIYMNDAKEKLGIE